MPAKLALLPGKVIEPKLRLWLKGPTDLNAVFPNLFLHTVVQWGAVANQFKNNLVVFLPTPPISTRNCSYNSPFKDLIMMMQQLMFFNIVCINLWKSENHPLHSALQNRQQMTVFGTATEVTGERTLWVTGYCSLMVRYYMGFPSTLAFLFRFLSWSMKSYLLSNWFFTPH